MVGLLISWIVILFFATLSGFMFMDLRISQAKIRALDHKIKLVAQQCKKED